MKNLDQSRVFETWTLSKENTVHWDDFISRVKNMVSSSRIKVVDVRRQGDKLTITYRKLT